MWREEIRMSDDRRIHRRIVYMKSDQSTMSGEVFRCSGSFVPSCSSTRRVIARLKCKTGVDCAADIEVERVQK